MHRPIRSFATICCLLAGTLAIAAENLPYPAREAVRRQSSNATKITEQLEVLRKQAEWRAYPYDVEEGLGLNPLLESMERDLTTNNVPQDHPDAAPLWTAISEARAALPDLEATLREKRAEWLRLADVANYPDWQRDLERIDQLYELYKEAAANGRRADGDLPQAAAGRPRYAQPMPGIERFAEATTSYNDDADYFNGLMPRYDLLLKTNPSAKATFMAKAKAAAKYMTEFHEVAEAATATFPAHIRHNLGVADQMAAMAKEQRQAGFFTGGVAQAMEAAKVVLQAYEGMKADDDPEALALRQEFDATTARMAAAEVELAEVILQEARLSPDRYEGADREAIIAEVRAAFVAKRPDDEILQIRIPSESWDRTTAWRSNAVEWYLVDYEQLVAHVVVPVNDTVAESVPVLISINHQKDDRRSVVVDHSGYAKRRVLRANIE